MFAATFQLISAFNAEQREHLATWATWVGALAGRAVHQLLTDVFRAELAPVDTAHAEQHRFLATWVRAPLVWDGDYHGFGKQGTRRVGPG